MACRLLAFALLFVLASFDGTALAVALPAAGDADTLAALNLDAPGMEKVKAAARAGDLAAAQEAYLAYRRTASPAKWRPMPSDEPPATATSDPVGDAICRHHIENFFYHGLPKEADMGADFDWTFNPVAPDNPDFTLEWTWCVISRTQFWRKLADAYWKTHDEKYAAEWVRQMEDFVAKNPLDRDGADGKVSLWRTLDASERMSDSWPYAYYRCLDSPAFTAEAQWTYLKSIRDHAACLAAGLRDPARTGNWVSFECFGLYTVGTLFPELKEAPAWRQSALDRIALEMERMVPPDGMEAELTPSYHEVARIGFSGPLDLAKLNGQPIPEAFRAKILAMFRALVVVMDQSGNDVPTNDCTNEINAMKLAKEGLKFGDDPLLRWAASGLKDGKGLPDSTMLPYAGFYAMRGGWKPDDQFLFFRAGPAGIGHEHEDMLEIVLRAWNKTLLFDPGSYVYDHSDWRRYTINTPSHNTLIVDGKWQHRGPNHVPVEKPVDNPWVTTPLCDFVAGTYDGGYQQNVYDPKRQYAPQQWIGPVDRSVTHTRRILYLRPYYALVLDTVDGTGTHVVDAHFHLDATAAHIDPATQAAFTDNIADNGDPIQLALYPLDRDHLAAAVVQGQKNPLLGWDPARHRAIPTVRFEKKQEAPFLFATFLYPFKGKSAPSFQAAPLEVGAGMWGQAVTTSKEKAEIVLAKQGTAMQTTSHLVFASTLSGVGNVTADAAGLVLRQPSPAPGDAAPNPPTWACAWGLTAFRDGFLDATLDHPGTLVIGFRDGHPLLFNGGDQPVLVTLRHPFIQTATLPPGGWTEIARDGARAATVAPLFASP